MIAAMGSLALRSAHGPSISSQATLDADDDSLWQTLGAAGLTDSTPNQEAEVRPRQQAFRPDRLLDFPAGGSHYRARASRYRNRPLQEMPLMRKADLRAHFPKKARRRIGGRSQGPRAAGCLVWLGRAECRDERTKTLIDGSLSPFPLRFREAWGLPSTDEEPRLAIPTTPLARAPMPPGGRALRAAALQTAYRLQFNSTDDLFNLDDRVSNIATEWADFRPEVVMVEPFYLHRVALARKPRRLPSAHPEWWSPAINSRIGAAARARKTTRTRRPGPLRRDRSGGGARRSSARAGDVTCAATVKILEILDSDGRPLTSGVGHAPSPPRIAWL